MSQEWQQQKIATPSGTLAVWYRPGQKRPALFFLHGVYLNRSIWHPLVEGLEEYPVYLVDMPFHGQSQEIESTWNLSDCAEMLIALITTLAVAPVYAIGHSWGSMTVLRAAVKQPELFLALGLANMPLDGSRLSRSLMFALQSSLMPFRRFYAQQAAKALFARASLSHNPNFVPEFTRMINALSLKQLKYVDRQVVVHPDSGYPYLKKLTVPALALKGELDYVPAPPGLALTVVPGGHISPLEAPTDFQRWIQSVLSLARHT